MGQSASVSTSIMGEVGLLGVMNRIEVAIERAKKHGSVINIPSDNEIISPPPPPHTPIPYTNALTVVGRKAVMNFLKT